MQKILNSLKSFFINAMGKLKLLFKRNNRRTSKRGNSGLKKRISFAKNSSKKARGAYSNRVVSERTAKTVKKASHSKGFSGVKLWVMNAAGCVGGFFKKAFALITGFFKALFKKIAGLASRFDKKLVYGCAAGAGTLVVAGIVAIIVFAAPGRAASAAAPEDVVPQSDVEVMMEVAEPDTLADVHTADEITELSFSYGDEGEFVSEIQQRLMALDFMDDDIPNDTYGDTTVQAIKYFQRKNGLEVDGSCGAVTMAKLFSTSAKSYTVSEGDTGQDVGEIQDRLLELGYIDAGTYTNETFNTATTTAVKAFQQKNNLSADGTVGRDTMEMLYSENAKANFLSFGEKSDKVLKYQQKLKALNYLSSEPDGTYGQDTVDAVKRFQNLNGIIADGFLGPSTMQLLDSGNGKANALVLGVSGNDVLKMQKRLKELKYLSSATGYFGSDTETAIMKFQKRNGLTADGKAGINTLNKLYSSSARKNSSSSSFSGGKKPSTSTGGSSSSGSGSSSGGNTIYKGSVSSLLSVAQSKIGCRYVKGAKGPNSFDCSGFVYWCLRQVGVNQSYWTSSTWRGNGKYQKISSMSAIQAGDIVVFGNGLNHVGIALGGGSMIDASSGDGCIRITSLSKAYWVSHFYAAYRVIG